MGRSPTPQKEHHHHDPRVHEEESRNRFSLVAAGYREHLGVPLRRHQPAHLDDVPEVPAMTSLSTMRRVYLAQKAHRKALRMAMFAAGPACDDTTADLFTAPDVFEIEPDAVREEREATAKQICATCPARTECLAYARFIHPTEGVWAGLTAEEIHTSPLYRRSPAGSGQEVA
ncbi:WhiB family transcriptional regulator [Streptosporangium sp. NBC_01469]|uniref:WhiB family transcriptional regulator n=1 Tax=Streptosporangium sp. NBC_01469 TaxID=2903898 RepID=UPI002E2A624E|nr:WhiB family transcriptional regulator [Streptosporangium sp. NBC_01469]